jgi:hypothetical protein
MMAHPRITQGMNCNLFFIVNCFVKTMTHLRWDLVRCRAGPVCFVNFCFFARCGKRVFCSLTTLVIVHEVSVFWKRRVHELTGIFVEFILRSIPAFPDCFGKFVYSKCYEVELPYLYSCMFMTSWKKIVIPFWFQVINFINDGFFGKKRTEKSSTNQSLSSCHCYKHESFLNS